MGAYERWQKWAEEAYEEKPWYTNSSAWFGDFDHAFSTQKAWGAMVMCGFFVYFFSIEPDEDPGELVELFVEDPAGDPDYVESDAVETFASIRDEHPDSDQSSTSVLLEDFFVGAVSDANGLEHDVGATTCLRRR
jgi:hypothetical protein